MNAQHWLDDSYSKEEIKEIKRLDINNKGLTGSLDLSDFFSLEWLNCSNNKLTSLDLKSCQKLEEIHCYSNEIKEINLTKLDQLRKLDAGYNLLTDLDFSAFNAENLLELKLHSNNFDNQNIDCFSPFTRLEVLLICTDDNGKIEQNIYNRFHGNLKTLREMNNLRELDIRATDIEGGLEYLPADIKEFKYSSLFRPEAKAQKIFRELQSQLNKLSTLVFPNQSYDFTQFRQEIARLKYQELAPHAREEKATFEQLINEAKEKAGEGSFAPIINLLLEANHQNEQTVESSQKDKLSGKIEAYKTILQTKLTQEELQTLLNKQTELSQLEKHLENLQKNQKRPANCQTQFG
ncbi:7585_t:CDS:1 [Diversispora eburnea]|uniref:7585_t:CDS:1 n=1 Tax=Diversispora eburnea TaxID=1213867 RepID=A0A9N9EVC8_9GLOM|nr:7585_t:CDS:1 [Diversispora eburnea]